MVKAETVLIAGAIIAGIAGIYFFVYKPLAGAAGAVGDAFAALSGGVGAVGGAIVSAGEQVYAATEAAKPNIVAQDVLEPQVWTDVIPKILNTPIVSLFTIPAGNTPPIVSFNPIQAAQNLPSTTALNVWDSLRTTFGGVPLIGIPFFGVPATVATSFVYAGARTAAQIQVQRAPIIQSSGSRSIAQTVSAPTSINARSGTATQLISRGVLGGVTPMQYPAGANAPVNRQGTYVFRGSTITAKPMTAKSAISGNVYGLLR
jgi:hypothetical protein